MVTDIDVIVNISLSTNTPTPITQKAERYAVNHKNGIKFSFENRSPDASYIVGNKVPRIHG